MGDVYKRQKHNFFHGIAEELSLGAWTAPAERVTGGYLHEMYKLSLIHIYEGLQGRTTESCRA